MNRLTFLVIAFMLAFLTESFVEYLFGIPMQKIPKLQPYTWALNYVALVAGVAMAFYYTIDLIAMVAQIAGGSMAVTPVGIALTGMIIGRGLKKTIIPIRRVSSVLTGYVTGYVSGTKSVTSEMTGYAATSVL